MPRTRVDALLVERGLFESRSRAAAAVMAGAVRVGAARAAKPGQLVPEDAELAVDQGPAYVSRGGVKLSNALEALGIDPAGRSCLDLGASTGGFTDCLLQRGAERVICVDVGYGDLDWRLREDPRVEVRERVNARALTAGDLPWAPDLIVADLSFISLTKALGAALALATERFDCLALVKPQFEAGRETVGRGGVVRDAGDRRSALVAVGDWARSQGWAVMGYVPSGLPGPAGNLESFVHIAEPGRPGAAEDIDAAARRAEP
jgi:23S rRNA (cytidine1920-2'-O)/16S rRNA (cytidine1409-2'-O)-methyltransferase